VGSRLKELKCLWLSGSAGHIHAEFPPIVSIDAGPAKGLRVNGREAHISCKQATSRLIGMQMPFVAHSRVSLVDLRFAIPSGSAEDEK
jgi:hypothetical protein